jgi:hypothetical protein
VDDRKGVPRYPSNISYRSTWRLRHEVGIDYFDIDLAGGFSWPLLCHLQNPFLFYYAFRSEYGIVVIDCFHSAMLSSTFSSFNEKRPISTCGNRFAQEAS